MKHTLRAVCLLLTALYLPMTAAAAKTVKIKLTGTAHEKMLMTIGQTGRTEVISDFPYVFEVPKAQMPVRLKFQSDNYIYYNIDVPVKPFDSTGHVYLVKINENAMNLAQRQNVAAPAVGSAPVSSVTASAGPDLSKGVNAAPVTGKNNANTFALIIANEEYEMVPNVDNAANDGMVFKEYCLKTLGLPAGNVKYFSNLTYGKMRKAMADIVDLASIVGPEAKLMVYYAGHGIPDNKTKNAFLMPVDADGTDTDVCLSLGDFYDRLNASSAGLCLVFLDACFSGAQRGGDMIVAARGVKLRPQPAAPKGNTVVFSATSGDEAAYSYKDEEHGLFTYFLLKKMQESKGNVSLGALADYLTKQVSVQSRLINNNPQTPTVNVANALNDSWRSIKLIK
ncbi:MAG: caspase family protein [Candidatus Amulumruptor caecigallinarius]|nr:caspase family protein [Candidatus Amulumruptor caecigallinarius]MCM1396369.1 caspase family protein [Candidatus Amulumruptor caecigallinarius]MCM1453689.1 caspase family protein [bacterium]